MFLYGFVKSERANIPRDEETAFKEAARYVLALTERQRAELIREGDCVEVQGPPETEKGIRGQLLKTGAQKLVRRLLEHEVS
jgi:hypothetical protein